MLAIIEVVYYCLKTIVWPSWRCVLDHCPAENIAHPQLSTILSPKIWQYWLTFIFYLTSISIPILFQPICPHTIRSFHPSHFTVADVGQYEMNLILFFHTYTTLFDSIIFFIVLSDYKTVFESSTVQFLCSWANTRYLWQWVFFNMGIFFFVTDQKLLL